MANLIYNTLTFYKYAFPNWDEDWESFKKHFKMVLVLTGLFLTCLISAHGEQKLGYRGYQCPGLTGLTSGKGQSCLFTEGGISHVGLKSGNRQGRVALDSECIGA